MSITDELFHRANDMCRRWAYMQWHRGKSKQQILRSQAGFRDISSTRPHPCQGCTHYHGIAYGTSRTRRSLLVCGMHPHGWVGGVLIGVGSRGRVLNFKF